MTTPPPAPLPSSTVQPPPFLSIQQERSSSLAVLVVMILAYATMSMLAAAMPSMSMVLRSSTSMSTSTMAMLFSIPVVIQFVMQPVVGVLCDQLPVPALLPLGLALHAAAVGVIGIASTPTMVIAAMVLVGVGQGFFRPEAARIVRLADGGWHGSAMGFYMAAASAAVITGPLLGVAVGSMGQRAAFVFALAALPAIALLAWVASWHAKLVAVKRRMKAQPMAAGYGYAPQAYVQGAGFVPGYPQPEDAQPISAGAKVVAILILMAAAVTRYTFLTVASNAMIVYLQAHLQQSPAEFGVWVAIQSALLGLGVLIGGVTSDWVGQRALILGSAVTTAVAAIAMTHVPPEMVSPVMMAAYFLLGLGMAPILTAMQSLAPKLSGLMAGLFFGVCSALGTLALGLIRVVGTDELFRVCSYLPIAGLIVLLLPLAMTKDDRPGVKNRPVL